MKYLKKYKIFLEDSYEIKDSDTEDVKKSKEQLNITKKQIDEYKNNKAKIVNIYKNAKSISEVNDDIEKILSTENPFLIELANLERMKREIILFTEDNVNDKIKMDDFNSSLSLANDNESKTNINSKINDIRIRIADRNKKIIEIKSNISKYEKDHMEKMVKMTKEIDDWVSKIS
jgi:hypothetical protein